MFNISKLLKISTLLVLSFPLILTNGQTLASGKSPEPSQPAALFLEVYKNPNCGCCKKWIANLNGKHIQTKSHESANITQLKKSLGIQPKFYSCHTALSKDGYVFEGHIPAKYIKQFLKERPKGAIGLSVPSMPVGSPGMEYQGKFMPYNIILMRKDGSSAVYAQITIASDQI